MTCKTHPDAPHGFDRNGSHSEDRYVCMCEHWEPPQPDPMELVRDLEKFATNPSERLLAKELGSLLFDHSTLKVENAKLKKDLRDYMLAANAEAELVDELQKEAEGLKDRIQSIYGQLNDTEKEVDDLRLLLRQALEALEAMNPYPASKEEQRATAITAIRARLNLTEGS
jgi:chromosome segregation ATPase